MDNFLQIFSLPPLCTPNLSGVGVRKKMIDGLGYGDKRLDGLGKKRTKGHINMTLSSPETDWILFSLAYYLLTM